MSDGVHTYASFLLASQLNKLPQDGILVPLSVCMLKRTVSNTLSDGRCVLTIIDMEVVASAADSGGQVGDPIPYKPGLASSSPTSSPSFDASPGPSSSHTSTSYRGQGSGLVGMSPLKTSPMKASPMEASPMKASPMKASPMEASPMEASPMKASPMKGGSSTAARPTVISISDLHPYISKWTLRARVTHKSDVRNWSNSRGDGKLFSFEIVDESGEIRIAAFNQEVDKFFSLVEQGKVYYISNGTLKPANKQYTTVKNDFEMTLNANSSIVLCDDNQRIPMVHCDFVSIAELDHRDKDALVASTSYRGQGSGLVGMSPLKTSPMKASPMEASPMKASPMKTSPMEASPMKASPMEASPMKFSPMKGGSSTAARPTVVSISDLHPYISKWTLRARVTHKSDVRNWSNSRGDGKLFSFEIVDESGEIRIAAFNQEVDKFFSLVEQGKVYYISNGTLKPANKQYTTVKNDFEMTLNANSSIVLCDDNQRIPMVHCDFVSIAELDHRDIDALVDVIGLCKSADDVSLITTRAGREVSKRDLHLLDMSGKEVTATIWGDEAVKFDGSGQPVVVIKGARLSDFGGRSLSASFNSTLMVNPDIPEAFRLRAWYDREGHSLDSQSLTQTRSLGRGLTTNWKTLSDIKTEQMGHTEKADYFSCVATVAYIRKENCLYRACPSADCNKKVMELEAGLWRCDKCDREFPTFKYRLLLSVNLADYGDQQWVTCFQDTAEVLLGQSAESLGHLRDTDEAAFDEVFRRVNLTSHIFKNRVKLETYNDECRVKVTVLEVLPVDHREYSRRLIRNIHKLAV
ncbi:replication protein A 70 kDa DNA-binding subunit-like isoform X2 [Synchiropus splendidus]|nr:replication protein A 70 kDa DNA-binding subunit-like isoform X2 [Synchiropus splendidus]